ncbi:MAG TPA: hypothetical protein VFM12_06400 [Gemmatimonadales bacterium]|nr:hypothetical protein [Gemmatimonadales bacterium]
MNGPQDYRVDYRIVDEQNNRLGEGWCYLPLVLAGDLPSLDWLSAEVTRQLLRQGSLLESHRVRVISCRPRRPGQK